MNYRALKDHKFFRPAIGAALSVVCGLALWIMPLGESWENASYDYLYRFGTRFVSNNVVLVFMDDAAYHDLDQARPTWDRALHTRLVNKLADDKCPLAVFDVFFLKQLDPAKDAGLAAALGRLNKVVLGARPAEVEETGARAGEIHMPLAEFLAAAKTNWGLGSTYRSTNTDNSVRRDWPSPDPDRYPSLPWTAARLQGANLRGLPAERWLRYYGPEGPWSSLSYHLALTKEPGYYHDKVVFIGNKPEMPSAGIPEKDKFSTPYTRWSNEAVGGVEIHATAYLNLLNGEWLRRFPSWVEVMVLIAAGILFGAGLCRFSRGPAIGIAAVAALGLVAGGVALSQITNFWFPWLIVVGGQIPCALACILIPVKVPAKSVSTPAPAPAPAQGPAGTIVLQFPEERPPDAPEYELFEPPIGQGGFGKVWIVRNAIGQWQALKAVYQSKFGDNTKPYESEFNGLQKYKPVSEKHPGLLRIELVSKMKAEGYFYYVMELGDAQAPGWEQKPASYKPRDLEYLRKQATDRRLPIIETLRVVTVLAEALDYLHCQGLTHRDIKPSNVIFVNGRPKLADIGLVTNIRAPEQINTLVGTLGYMPPPPEPPGTPHADIFALGMLLYVITTGRDPVFFPDLATTLMERSGYPEFVRVNAIILKACQPEIARRYQTAGEMLWDLQEASKSIDPD